MAGVLFICVLTGRCVRILLLPLPLACFFTTSFLPSFLLSAHRHAPQARLQTHLQTGRRPFKSVHARTQPVPLMLTTATGARLFSTTIPRRADVTLTIDGKEVSVPAGTALIQACEKAYVILSF